MSDYTQVNLLEIENSSTNENVRSYFARKHIDSKELGVSLFSYGPNYQSDFAHSHKEQEEVYAVVKGGGKLLLGDKVLILNSWDIVRVAPNVVRAFASGPKGLDVLAIGGQRPEGGDGVRYDATWPTS